ncbi:MAG: sulfotransferase [Candidatus Hodarchaeota archaeon]
MTANNVIIKDPAFIIYDPRSGSTFLSNLLIKNSRIAIPPESNFMPLIFENFKKTRIENLHDLKVILDITYNDSKFSDWGIPKAVIKEQITDVLPTSIREYILLIISIFMKEKFPDAELFAIKKDNYMRYHKQIKALFPFSKFIALIRDGRAVFNSKKVSIHSERLRPFENDVIKAAERWCNTVSLLHDIKKTYETDTLIIYYETLIEDTNRILSQICDFLDLEYLSNPRKFKFLLTERYGQDLHKNIDKEPLSARIDAWKDDLSREEIFVYESIAYKHLMAEGYQLMVSEGGLEETVNRLKSSKT